MITKTTPKGWMLSLLSALFLLSGLTACSSTEDSTEDSAKPKPEVPINDDDWQTVPATGGTITKDSLSIIFTSGTFSGDTKVAITNLKDGFVCDENEVSNFYMVTMPITTHKPTTIKIKSDTKADDVCMILHSSYLVRSTGEIKESDFILDTSYSNGEYSAQLTTFNNEDETITDDFKIGLAHINSLGASGKTRTTDEALSKGEVKGVKWKLCATTKADKPGTYTNAFNPITIKKVGRYIEEALTIIRDQGYVIKDTKRVIPYYYDVLKEKWGEFNQSKDDDKYSTLGLSVKDINDRIDSDTLSLKSTILHETFHYFQADYDPRTAFTKKGGFGGKAMRNENILYEMGAVWMEQFLRGGSLDAGFLKQDVFKEQYINLLGLGLEELRWGRELNINDACQQQGYTMAPLLYYFTKELSHLGFDKKAVLKLHQIWNEKWTDSYTSYFILDEWVKSYDISFFPGSDIDDYYLKLWKGDLVKDLRISSIVSENMETNVIASNREKRKIQFVDNCYPFGCGVKMVAIRNFKDSVMTNKELVIKQFSKDVHTYVFLTDISSDMQKFKYVQRNGKIFALEAGDSIVLNGKTLESLRLTEGNNAGQYTHEFYLLTTNNSNLLHSKTVNPYNMTFELRDAKKEEEQTGKASVSKDKVFFEAEGGTDTTVKIDKGSYKYCNAEVPEEFEKWLSAKASDDGMVSITAQPNTGEEREGKIKCWVSNKENPSPSDKKYIDPSVTVTQKAGDSESLLDQTDLVFPVEGGVRFIKYGFGPYLWMKKTWDDDSWLRTTWSIDYLSNIGYNPSNENRYANQLYVCCFPNETGSDREQTITFSYANEKGFDFDKGDKFPVKVKQEGGVFNLDMMKNLFVGTWYTPSDIEYNRSEGHYYHRRYTFRADNTIILEGKTTNSASKPATWDTEFTGTYSILSYEVKGDRVRVYIKVPKDDTWYKIRIERFPHFIYFAYENSDGSLWHGVYMEPE